MKNTKIEDEYDLKLIEENLDKFEHDFKKKMDDILKDLTKADWGKMKKFMKKDINLYISIGKMHFTERKKLNNIVKH